ncbi:uncharacterized protein LOC62_04G005848 [Vanrija pseudolonga]|uniref:Uncharacterized protein n=1 Tax=Vanrija pseudolonga TaxID=143232 RepID=A0AAF0YCK5_9TREE|nr:hypothetical protein LOC62_04G005848 [Vanrija pseudolonga]
MPPLVEFDHMAYLRNNSKLFSVDREELDAAEKACTRALETGHGWDEALAHFEALVQCDVRQYEEFITQEWLQYRRVRAAMIEERMPVDTVLKFEQSVFRTTGTTYFSMKRKSVDPADGREKRLKDAEWGSMKRKPGDADGAPEQAPLEKKQKTSVGGYRGNGA